jgi:hypothetical protein
MPTIVMEHRHSPALLIPPAFGIEDFRRLIDIFHTRGKTFFEQKVAADRLGTDYKMRVPEHLREHRIDQFFFDRDTVAFLKQRLNRRIREIFRAFQYRTAKHKSLRMAQYEGGTWVWTPRQHSTFYAAPFCYVKTSIRTNSRVLPWHFPRSEIYATDQSQEQ